MPSQLLYRPRWPNQIGYMELIEDVFNLYLQHRPYEDTDGIEGIVTIVSRKRAAEGKPGISVATAKRCVQRAKALTAGSFVRNLQQMTETAAAQRFAIVSEAWMEIQRVEADPLLTRREKTQAKKLMMDTLNSNHDALEELLGMRKQETNVTATQQNLIVIGGDSAAERIASMGKLLDAVRHTPATVEQIDDALNVIDVRSINAS